jgi:hypothetical protein
MITQALLGCRGATLTNAFVANVFYLLYVLDERVRQGWRSEESPSTTGVIARIPKGEPP